MTLPIFVSLLALAFIAVEIFHTGNSANESSTPVVQSNGPYRKRELKLARIKDASVDAANVKDLKTDEIGQELEIKEEVLLSQEQKQFETELLREAHSTPLQVASEKSKEKLVTEEVNIYEIPVPK